ncbi:bifunctional aminoglycoside phosphotransferase/ATP-binding protein [Nocardia paucivorans]|uniref:bifunctional aminoglycoside phosphotransferase/ATP-binding protein n=1 Tax=Nocardia paucivorans TaxID=114259 RepID=UPI0002FB6548|nr:AAA family ATPase [Nocardia paucivorans]
MSQAPTRPQMTSPVAPFATATDTGALLHETHTGLVVLFGNRAYKVKKPITTDFLDFGTPLSRERACRREYELNRRLAPDVYLGVAHLSDPLGGPEEPVLVMRRMPEQRRLSTMLSDSTADGTRLSVLVRTLVAFHDRARRGPDIDRAGTADALRERWLTVLDTLRRQPGDLIEPGRIADVEDRAMRYIRGRVPLFEHRIADGRIVDGHGDLLAQDIFDLPDGFRILDCLDFDDRLRHIDRLDDIAFLAMDLEFLGHPEQADALIADYLRFGSDDAPLSLAHHYRAYRALVRAKVDAIRFAQGEVTARDRLRRHVSLAERHLARGTIRLALVGGLPGTGKTTVANRLAAVTGSQVLATDRVRRELIARGEISGAVGVYDAGAYAPDARSRVYTELFDRARRLLTTGVSVVLDASWSDASQRQRALELAAATDAEPVRLCCECPRETADHRLRNRPPTESDATPEIAHAIADSAAAWPEADLLDTTRPLDLVVAEAVARWHDTPPGGVARTVS